MIKYLIRICFFTFFLVFVVSSLNGQDKPKRVYMYLQFYNIIDQEKYLEVELKYRVGKDFAQLADAEIVFSYLTEEDEIEIGTITTGEDGFAIFPLDNGLNTYVDTSGFTTYAARFSGMEGFRKSSKEVAIKDISLNLQLDVVDSVKIAKIEALEVLPDSEGEPVSEVPVSFYVKRLYDDLPLENGELDEGEVEFAFPDDIPGNQDGTVSVIARIIDHEDYGNVEIRQDIDWGIPVSYELIDPSRELWSRAAPIWMLIAFGVVMIAVWGHFGFVVLRLYQIKKANTIH